MKEFAADPHAGMHPQTVIEHFGTWNAAKRAAGLDAAPLRDPRGARRASCAALGEELGRTPTAHDIRARRGTMPSTSLYWHTFGSLATALREAGFDVAVGEERLERAVDQGSELARRLGRLPKFGDWQEARRADSSLLTEWQVYRLFEARRGAWATFQYLVRERLLEEGATVSADGTVAKSATTIKQGRPAGGTIRPMSATTDTFARFVEVLAETLDDREASGEALASRMHLSRFHFDRLVSAAAGEPPASLRRRVLLERAAYRLITTDDDVLTIALDAGYSSHEAFTRAFTRAYGAAPSRWRRQPTRFQIEAPSEVHFNPPGGLRVPADRKVTAMDLLNRMVEHHVWLVGEMVEPRRVGSTKPCSMHGSRSRSRASTATRRCARCSSRLVGQLAMWDAATHDRSYDLNDERGETVAEMRRQARRGRGRRSSRSVREVVDEGRLDETFVDAICDPPEVFTYGGMIAHVLTFAAHRRTLVCGALQDAGITDLGAGDPMRWVAAA